MPVVPIVSAQPLRVEMFDDFVTRLDNPRLRLAYAVLCGQMPADYEKRKSAGQLLPVEVFTRQELRAYARMFDYMKKNFGEDVPQVFEKMTEWISTSFSTVVDWIRKHVLAAVSGMGGKFMEGALDKIRAVFSAPIQTIQDLARATMDAVSGALKFTGMVSLTELVLSVLFAAAAWFAPYGQVGSIVKIVLSFVAGFFGGASLFHGILQLISALSGKELIGNVFDQMSKTEVAKRMKSAEVVEMRRG